MGVELNLPDWQVVGYDVPLLVNCQPAGKYLGEAFHRAGGVPGVMRELIGAGRIHADVMTVTGSTIGDNHADVPEPDREVIFTYDQPLQEKAGFLVLSGNIFDGALIKTCVISDVFRERYLSARGSENVFTARAVVFDGPEDYHARIDDPELAIDERSLLVIRGCGPVGYPGAAEVVNMQPPAALIKDGIRTLPTMGDGRQSGTSASPSILNVSPESAVGGNLGLVKTGDEIRVDLNTCQVDLQVSDEELAKRREVLPEVSLEHQTPWQEIYRANVGQLSTGGCLELATNYHCVADCLARHNH